MSFERHLTERLRKQGVSVGVAEAKQTNLRETLVGLVPFVLVLALWLLRIRRMQVPKLPPASAPPQNQPLGD
jgi:hypothetical protein